jgi:hypothetical protein
MRTDEKHRHECEVRDCIKRFFPDGQAMAAHLEKIAKRRGQQAADRLRADALIALQKRRAES